MPPPRLLIEVVSSGNENSENYKRDYIEKRNQYAAIGVPEYWIIDPDRKMISVLSLQGTEYQSQQFLEDEIIISPTFPQLNLTISSLI